MKIIYNDKLFDVFIGTEYIKILCTDGILDPQKVELEIEDLANKFGVSNDQARRTLGIKEYVGEREVPRMIRGILSSFGGHIYPQKDEVVCFAALDPRYSTPILWRAKS